MHDVPQLWTPLAWIPHSWPHLHILAAVFPAFGLLCVLPFLVAGMVRDDTATRRTSLVFLAGIAVLAIPVYVSGTAALAELAGNTRFAAAAVAAHQGLGVVALAALGMTGIAAVITLALTATPRRGSDALIVVVGLAVVSLVLAAATDGWQLNHRELAATTAIPDVTTPALWPRLHLILNHAPTVGFVFALAFYVVALIAGNDLMKRGSLVLFVVCAVLGVPTYVTGTAAMWALTQPADPAISRAVIDAHRDMALLTLIGLAVTGGAAWLTLWRSRDLGRLPPAALTAVLVLAVVTLAVMTETGHRGGLINHPEIFPRPAASADSVTVALERLMTGNAVFVPAQIAHYVGFCLIFAAALALALRAFGWWPSVSFAAVHRLLVLGFAGVVVNVVSGMLMMLRASYQYVVSDAAFAPKIALITVGAVAALYFSVSGTVLKVRPGDDAPALAKWMAAVVLVAFTGAIVCGRLLNFL